MGVDELVESIESSLDGEGQIGETRDVQLIELFPTSFMRRYTDYESIAAFFEASRWNVESQADFEAIPADELDGYVAAKTVFTTWDAMTTRAGEEWTTKQLGR